MNGALAYRVIKYEYEDKNKKHSSVGKIFN